VPGKVANREPFAVRDSPDIFIMRGWGLRLVLGFDNAWASGGGESEAGRNKTKKQKVSLPLLLVQGKKKKKSAT
jgi:hypothetical protein